MENEHNRCGIFNRNTIINIISTIFFILFYLIFIAFTYHRMLIYFPSHFDFNLDKYTIKTLDNKDLDIYCIDNKSDIDFMIFHGNAVNPLIHSQLVNKISRLNVNVFTIFYRGFNKRDGHPSELNIKIDVEAVYRFLNNRKNKIIIYGYSLGGGPAIYLASLFNNPPPLILDNVIYDMQTHLEPYHFLNACAKIVLVDQWKNGEVFKNLNTNVLFFRSEFDQILSEEHIKKYVKISKKQPEIIKVSNATHHNVLYFDIFLIEIKKFISKHTQPQ